MLLVMRQKEKTMKIIINGETFGDELTDIPSKTAFGLHVAELLEESGTLDRRIPEELTADDGTHRVLYRFGQNGIHAETDSSFVMEEPIKNRYFVLVDPVRGRNEVCRMNNAGDDQFQETVGPVGANIRFRRRAAKATLPVTRSNAVYGLEVLMRKRDGFTDRSDCHRLRVVDSAPKKGIIGADDADTERIISYLNSASRRALLDNYKSVCVAVDVTPEQIKSARAAMDAMRAAGSLGDFNRALVELMEIVPRRIPMGRGCVSAMLAKEENDRGPVIVREKELLDALETQSTIQKKAAGTLISKLGISVSAGSDKDRRFVERHLAGSLQKRLKTVLRVSKPAADAALEHYCKRWTNGEKTKFFWHGSRNENWLSILQKGLLLNPEATITGKMFGNGIYFAPDADKSFGYTSCGKWVGSSAPSVFMAMFETAYGHPYMVYSWGGRVGNMTYHGLAQSGTQYDCLHASSKSGMLHADEVVFYREDQMAIRYLCEFR